MVGCYVVGCGVVCDALGCDSLVCVSAQSLVFTHFSSPISETLICAGILKGRCVMGCYGVGCGVV